VTGVRFLPPYDPYLLDRDRDLLVPQRAAQRTVWRASGNPGVVLVDGEPVATWRSRKHSPAGVSIVPLDLAAPVDEGAVMEELAGIRDLL